MKKLLGQEFHRSSPIVHIGRVHLEEVGPPPSSQFLLLPCLLLPPSMVALHLWRTSLRQNTLRIGIGHVLVCVVRVRLRLIDLLQSPTPQPSND